MAKDPRELEEAQRRSDAQYRAVVNHAAEAIVVAQDGLVVFANPRAAEITGYPPNEMSGLTLQDLLYPEDLPLIADRTRQRAEGTLSDPYSYFRIVRKDGALRSVQSCPVTIEWEGRPASLAFIADLSEKQAAEEAVRRSEERLRLVVDNVGEGILVGLDDGRIVFANTRAATMSGRTTEELMQSDLRELIHPDDYEPTIARAIARLQGQTADRHSDYRVLHKDGSEIWVRSSPVIIDWNGRPAVLAFLVDLTEQRANEAALRRSEQRYREVVEHVTEGIVVAQDARIVFANPKAAAMSGRAVEELVGLPFSSVIHPEDLAEAAARDQRRLRGEQIDRFTTYRALHKDGHSFWVQSSPVTIDWEGRPATLTFLIDLTERRAAEEALRRSEHRYREVVENGSDGIFVVDGPHFVFANNRFLQFSGYTHDELIGREVFELVVPEDIPVLMERYRQRDPNDTKPEASLDWRIRHKDGRAVWVRSRAVQIHWEGKPVSLAFISDITAQREAEQALRISEERYRLVVEHVEEGIIVVQDGVLKLCNSSTVNIVGYPIEDLVGHSITHFIHPEDLPQVLTNYQARLRGEPQGARYDFRVITKEGRTVWVELGAVLFEWEGRPATLSFLIDVTVRKQAEEATRIALEQQQELNYLKTRFLSMTSHEFRTPLATILSSTELLRYYGDRLPGEEKTELCSTIESAVKRMTQLLEDVLVIGKQDSGAERLVRAPLDVTEYCRALCTEVVIAEEALGRTGRQVDVSFEGDCGYAQLDANQLRHVLVNLLSNAIKYTPAGRQVSFRVSGDARQIVFEVADQGIGIAAEDRGHLFELFFRARNVGNIAGTGLGLAIVKRAVDLHCGDIAVSSALGEGTRFTVRLPRGELPP